MQRDESTASKKIYLKVEWGASKIIDLEKYSFGDEFFYAGGVQIEVSKSVGVSNPLFVYPVDFRVDSNPAAKVLDQFHETGSLVPECSLWIRLAGGQYRDILEYRFKTVRVLERFGRRGDRRFSYYKLRFDNWFGR